MTYLAFDILLITLNIDGLPDQHSQNLSHILSDKGGENASKINLTTLNGNIIIFSIGLIFLGFKGGGKNLIT